MGRSKRFPTMATLSDLQAAAMNETPMPTEELKKIFEALDTNPPQGQIPRGEFVKSLKIFGGENAFKDDEIKILETEMGMAESQMFNYLEFLELRKVLLGRKL